MGDGTPATSFPTGSTPPSRVVQNHTLDSARWRDFVFRPGDVVISSWAKAGTTWTQQIVAQLIWGGEAPRLWDLCAWVDSRLYSRKQMFRRLAAQTTRRSLKTHLPADALPMSPLARYVYIARDGRDIAWSWYHHHRNIAPVIYEVTNSLGGRVGPPLEPPIEPFEDFFRAWLERDGYPLWPFWSHVLSWWQLRAQDNVLLVHFADLKADLPAAIRRIASFLGVDSYQDRLDEIVHRCSFEYMKAQADKMLPLHDSMSGGAQSFIRQGTIGGWRAALSKESAARYEAVAREQLPEDCRRWLESGTAGR